MWRLGEPVGVDEDPNIVQSHTLGVSVAAQPVFSIRTTVIRRKRNNKLRLYTI